MQFRVLGIVEEGLKRLPGGPLHEDHHRARLDPWLYLLDPVQPAQSHDPPTVLAHGFGRATRVLPVGIVAGQIEQVKGVQRPPYCAAIFVFAASGLS